MTRSALEIYDDLKALANELEDLTATGRITMSTDLWGKDYPETKQAVYQALAALQIEINATRWMEDCPQQYPLRSTRRRARKPPAPCGQVSRRNLPTDRKQAMKHIKGHYAQ